MPVSYGSSIGVSFGVSNGNDEEVESHDIDTAVGPVSDGDGETSGSGATAFGDAVAVGDDTAVVGVSDVSVAENSTDASAGTLAHAEGEPGSLVYTSAMTSLEAYGSAPAGVSISHEHSSYSSDEAGVSQTSQSYERVVMVDPQVSGDGGGPPDGGPSDPTDEPPEYEPATLEAEGIEGNTAIFDLAVSAAGEHSFVSLDLSAFAVEDFSTITFLSIAEIA